MHIDCILLTRFFSNAADFHEWCRHHLSIGFDHIQVFDDGNPFDMERECTKYGDKITYERVHKPQQYQLYNSYIPSCDADFVMPIDDDEYLWISPYLLTIKSALDYYINKFGKLDVLGIRWKYLFPKVFHSERQGTVLEYCTEDSDYLATRFFGYGNNIIKCIVRKDAFVKYIDADESISRNHIPLTKGTGGATLCDGHTIHKQWANGNVDDEQIRIIHCPYKGYTEYMRKQQNHLTVCRKEQRPRTYRAFNSILDSLA